MRKILPILFIGILIFLIEINSASAEGLVPCDVNCTLCDLFQLAQNVLNFLVSPRGGLVFLTAIIAMLIGGILLLVSGGSIEMYNKGMFAFKAGIIGLAISLIAWVVINTILVFLAGGPQIKGVPWPWYKIECGSLTPPAPQPPPAQQWHTECEGNVCVRKEGPGSNQCMTNAECEARSRPGQPVYCRRPNPWDPNKTDCITFGNPSHCDTACSFVGGTCSSDPCPTQ
jgi:hypothetical protein